MPYVGNKPVNNFVSFAKQNITGNGGTSYSLDYPVTGANDIELFINNVRQEPTEAYSASGATLTLTGAISNTDDVYVIFRGRALQTVQHPADSALEAASANIDSGTFVVDAVNNRVGISMTSPFSDLHLGGGYSAPATSGNMADNGLTISNGSGGRAIQIGVDDASARSYIQAGYVNNANVANHLSILNGANESMRIDASGRVTMPYQVGFYSRKSISGDGRSAGAQEWSVNGQGSYNQGNHFNTSNGRFTAPVGGRYYFSAQPGYKQSSIDWNWYFDINGTHMAEPVRVIGGLSSHSAFAGSMIVALNAGDYVQVYAGNTHHVNTTYNYFCGHLIG